MCVPGGQGRRGLFEQLAESLRRQPGRSAGTFAGEKPENSDGAYALAGGTAAENPLRAAEEIARYAHRQPLLVVIDDLHHADPDSLDGILHLVRACRTARIMMVLVASDCSYEQMPLFHAELLRAPHYRRVRLRPLSRLAVAEVVAESLGSEVAERSAADYYRYSGGNPLALRALIQEWSSTRFTDEAGPETARGGTLAPGKVSALAVFTSLHRSGPQAMAVARGMALLGPAAGLDLLCQLLRSTPRTSPGICRTWRRPAYWTDSVSGTRASPRSSSPTRTSTTCGNCTWRRPPCWTRTGTAPCGWPAT